MGNNIVIKRLSSDIRALIEEDSTVSEICEKAFAETENTLAKSNYLEGYEGQERIAHALYEFLRSINSEEQKYSGAIFKIRARILWVIEEQNLWATLEGYKTPEQAAKAELDIDHADYMRMMMLYRDVLPYATSIGMDEEKIIGLPTRKLRAVVPILREIASPNRSGKGAGKGGHNRESAKLQAQRIENEVKEMGALEDDASNEDKKKIVFEYAIEEATSMPASSYQKRVLPIDPLEWVLAQSNGTKFALIKFENASQFDYFMKRAGQMLEEMPIHIDGKQGLSELRNTSFRLLAP